MGDIYGSSVDREMVEAIIEKAQGLGVNIDVRHSDLSDSDRRRDVAIRALSTMFAVLEAKLGYAIGELEHMYNSSYQTFHDTMEPARNIRKLSSILLKDIDDGREVDPEIVRVINASAAHIHQMLEDLHDLLMLRKRQDEDTDTFRLSDVVCDSVDHLKSEIDERGANVNVCGELPVITSNRSRWVRIFVNLIKNGITYNTSDAPSVTIECDGDVMYVVDNGMGIPEDEHERVFGVFERMSDRSHMSDGGTGSGLYQVERLLNDEGASISVDESSTGEGTAFKIDLSEVV